MGKLIDSDELKSLLKNLHLLATSGYGAEEVVGKIVDEMPDGIVRCKDCEYYTVEEKWCRRLGLCGAFNEDGFCSCGERRDGDGNG